MQYRKTSPHHLVPGTILIRRFLIERVLAEGGFGIIYFARDLELELTVAIKEYYPIGFANRNTTYSEEVVSSNNDAEAIFEKGKESFLEEARVLARFSEEPGIVYVRDRFTENNTAYIVMEYLNGITLKAWLKQNGVMSFGQVLDFIRPIITVLSKLHKTGYIHRDVSPDNIMVLRDNRTKLLDFGAAKETLTGKSLTIMVKHGYAPEEQYRTKGEQGPWTDIYALCATIYRCITGITPDQAIERMHQDKLERPSLLGIKIGLEQEAALMKGMSIYQKDRFQTIEELEQKLYECAPIVIDLKPAGDL